MENNILDNQGGKQTFSSDTMYNLSQLAKWMNLAAVISMVGQAVSLVSMIKTNQYSSIFGIFIGLGLALILFRAAKGLKQFCADGDHLGFETYGKSINQYFMVVGIILIIVMVIALAAVAIGISAM
jgi:hypothetical protein